VADLAISIEVDRQYMKKSNEFIHVLKNVKMQNENTKMLIATHADYSQEKSNLQGCKIISGFCLAILKRFMSVIFTHRGVLNLPCAQTRDVSTNPLFSL
jgi:hypothetical protein